MKFLFVFSPEDSLGGDSIAFLSYINVHVFVCSALRVFVCEGFVSDRFDSGGLTPTGHL